jgi:HK97 family phage major capsid protein
MASLYEQIQATKEKRAQLTSEARQIVERALDDKGNPRTLTAEEEANWKKAHEEERQLSDRIDKYIEEAEAESRRADQELRLAELEQVKPVIAGKPDTRASADNDSAAGEPGEERNEASETTRTAFDHYLRFGYSALAPEERAALRADTQRGAQLYPGSEIGAMARALGVSLDAGGGILVPQTMYARIVEGLKAFGGMRQAGCEIITTGDGGDFNIPTDNDTSNEGALLSENKATPEQDLAFGAVTMHAYTYTSKMIRVSMQLLQDSAYDVEAHITRKLSERIGRITNRHFTTGDGAAKPHGFTGQAAAVSATSATAISFDDVFTLEHKVDPAYRADPSCLFMLHDDILLELKKLKAGTGEYLWRPSIALNTPDTIDNRRYVVNQHMDATIASGKKTVAFGSFFPYKIRDVMGILIRRLDERYAEFGQIAFLAFARHDGSLVDAGTNPLKVLTH